MKLLIAQYMDILLTIAMALVIVGFAVFALPNLKLLMEPLILEMIS